MSDMALQLLIGTALTDPKFCEGLLTESRCELMAHFDLTDEERRAILEIRAASIQEFAAELTGWLEAWANDGHHDGRPQPPGMRHCLRLEQ